MSVSEYFYWYKYFGKRPFTLEMMDYGFGTLASSAYNVAAGKPITSASDFSVLDQKVKTDTEMSDDQLMAASGGVSGVLRIGSDQ